MERMSEVTDRRHRPVPAFSWGRRFLLLLALVFPAAAPAQAQTSRADTAAVLLDAARTFEAEGRLDLAEELMSLIVERYGETEAAAAAREEVVTVQVARRTGRGQAGYVVWSTIFGAWMGVAVPAALGAEDAEPYGLGLLIGAPTGFFASRAYGKATDITVGSSRTITYSWLWATWQAMGWRAALDLGESESLCSNFGCGSDAGRSPWVAAVVGGVVGYAAGVAATRAWDIDTGTVEMLWHSSIWGSGYGLALGFLAGLEDDDLLAGTLVGGNVGMVASIPASNAWSPSSGRVRLISVAGLAGAVAGLGIDLLLTVDDEKTAVAIPTIGATIGLIGGAAITSDDDPGPTPEEDVRGLQAALLQVGGGSGLGVPLPTPIRRSRVLPTGEVEFDLGLELKLFDLVF